MAVDKNTLILEFKYSARRANRSIKKTQDEVNRLRVSTSGLRRSLGVLRNNLLLVSFAAGAVVASIGKVVNVSARFESVKTRLVGLTGSVESAEKAFSTFNEVAATTPFSLEDVVNAGAQLQAFGADAEALIKPITNLAAFMGTTATEAANAFGRAYAGGAGAADILRERGILNIIKASQGLTDLSKTTLPDFREALIKSLQDPVVGIEGSTDRLSKTFLGMTSNMIDSLTRLAGATGNAILEFTNLEKSIKFVGDFSEKLARLINQTADPVSSLSERMKALNVQNAEFNKLIEEQKIAEFIEEVKGEDRAIDGLAFSIFNLLSEFGNLNQAFEENTTVVRGSGDRFVKTQLIAKGTAEGYEQIAEAVKRATESQAELVAKADRESLPALVRNLEILKDLRDALGMEEAQNEVFLDILPDETVFDSFQDQLTDLTQKSLDEVDKITAGYQARIDALGDFTDIAIDNEGFFQDALEESTSKLMDEQQVFEDRINIRVRDLEREREAMRETAEVFRGFSDNLASAIIHGQNLGDAVVNSIKAIAAELVAQAATLGLMKVFFGTGVTAAGLGLDLLGGIGKLFGFHQGGMIGGRGQNVPIIAQPGEFVMQRSAVQSIGASNLAEMNATGQPTSNVTVNIQGGVVDQDFVRNQLVPALNKEGARIAVV